MRPQELAERIVAQCRADGCVAVVTEQSEANLRWAASSVTSDALVTDRQVTVVATMEGAAGTRVGVASCRGGDDDEVASLVRCAESAARAAEPAEDAQPLVAGGGHSPSDWWAPPPPPATVAHLRSVAPALRHGFRDAQRLGHALFGYAAHRVRSIFLASSTGTRLRADLPTSHLELTARAPDDAGSAWVEITGDLTEQRVLEAQRQVGQQLRWGRRTLALPPGRYQVLLPPTAVADLMYHFYWAAGGREAMEGRTAFSAPGGGTRVGERLSEAPLTLRGDPAAPGLECAPFVVTSSSDGMVSVFDNGIPVPATAWLDRGILAALVQTRHSSQLTGLPLTPHVDNLMLEHADGRGTLADLVSRTERALLIASLWYVREVDPVKVLLTGLTRDGVYLVEQGEVVAAVNNFRFYESPVEVLRRVADAGVAEPTRSREHVDAFSHCAMPALRVDAFQLSSASRAV
jgi:predicted Zn-dependent protease